MASQALELKPRDPHAAAVLVESLWGVGETKRLDEFIAAEAWLVDDPQCALTIVRVWTERHRFDQALQIARRLVGEDSEDYDARLVLAGCLLATAQAGHSGDIIALCREAENQATRALELLSDKELPARRVLALSIRAGARLSLDDSADAMNDIEVALRDVPDDHDLPPIVVPMVKLVLRPSDLPMGRGGVV